MKRAFSLRRFLLWTLAVVSVLVVLGLGGMHLAAQSLKKSVLEALGSESQVADLRVGVTRIVATGVEVPAPKGWPTRRALSAERVEVLPDLRQLVSGDIHVNHATAQNAYIAGLRPKEGGGLKVLPSMLGDRKKAKAERSGREGRIDTVELKNCIVELFDATLTGHQKMRVDAVQGTVEDLNVPGLRGRSTVDLKGLIKGPMHQGTISVKGWFDAQKKSSEIATQVRNVDLALFEPYLIQKTKAGIDRGTFNLDMKATVRDNKLHAPGTLTLTGLKLKTGEGAMSGLSNLPRRAVIASLADENETITVPFELNGDLDNPAFSLSESLSIKTGLGLLKGFGLGFEALVRAFFILVNGFGSALGGAAGA